MDSRKRATNQTPKVGARGLVIVAWFDKCHQDGVIE
jgi:hypothetical protein